MSPTEHDLRAALRDGEGDGPDPDRLIALAQAQQARRRMQVLSTAVAVVLVAGAGTGIVALARSGGSDTKRAGSAAGAPADERIATAAAGGASLAPHSRSAPAAGGATASSNAGKAARAAVACPATLPRYALPGGGSPGQFGADQPLFDRAVTSVVVCVYDVVPAPSNATLAPARTAFSGTSARRLAASLNSAPASPATVCPKRDVTATAHDYAIIGLAADGTPLRTITVTRSASACADSQVTNGTAVRYNWTPPSDLLPILATLSPTPKMHGSPISS